MEITLNFKLDGDQLRAILASISQLTQGVNTMAAATVTGASALSALTDVLTTFLATDAQSIVLDQQLITALQTEVALLTSQNASAADPTKIEALVGQLAAANAARQAGNDAVSAVLAPVVTPPVTPPVVTPPTPPTLSDSTTTLTGPATAVTGASVQFDGSVTGAAPTGDVTLSDATGVVSGSAALDATGAYTVVLVAGLAAGSYSVTASYAGDAANHPSTSAAFALTVADAPAA